MTGRTAAAALGLGVALAVAQVIGLTPAAFDAGAYWAARPGDLYDPSWGIDTGRAAFLYSPAFAHALEPFRLLPEPIFRGLWQLALVAVLVATVRGWALVLMLAAVPYLAVGWLYPGALVLADIAHGNIHILLGAVAVLGLRYPALWSFALLSKITPGIGLLWFAFRGEWRSLAIALGATAAISAVSFALSPADWSAWAGFLAASAEHEFAFWVIPVALPVRLATAAMLLAWGARTDRPWVVPLAVGWSIPVAYPTMAAAMIGALAYARSADDRAPAPAQRRRGVVYQDLHDQLAEARQLVRRRQDALHGQLREARLLIGRRDDAFDRELAEARLLIGRRDDAFDRELAEAVVGHRARPKPSRRTLPSSRR